MPDQEIPSQDFDDESMPWETEAIRRVKDALDRIGFDEVRGVIYVLSGEDHHFNPIEEEFSDYDEMVDRRAEIYDEEWYANVPSDGGEAVFESDSHGAVSDLLAGTGAREFFEAMRPPTDGDELGDASDLLIPGGGLIVQRDLEEINDELIEYLARHPEMMHQMNSRKFEELVAALLKAKGYSVELTPATRDGGLDMRAFKKSDAGTILTMTECKRYGPENKVGVGVVRGLYGVVEESKATNGLIVTTSTFTKDAKAFQQKTRYRMELADVDILRTWLREHRNQPK